MQIYININYATHKNVFKFLTENASKKIKSFDQIPALNSRIFKHPPYTSHTRLMLAARFRVAIGVAIWWRNPTSQPGPNSLSQPSRRPQFVADNEPGWAIQNEDYFVWLNLNFFLFFMSQMPEPAASYWIKKIRICIYIYFLNFFY